MRRLLVLCNVGPKTKAALTNAQGSGSATVSRSGYSDICKYAKVSKVNGSFGRFHYRELSGDRIEIDPVWVAANITTREPNNSNVILWKKAFKPAGFNWGNSFNDSMHYELKR